MAYGQEDNPKLQFPLDSDAYKIIAEIGFGVSAVVYKAECVPLNSAVVTIKAIDLDQYNKADLDRIRREIKTISLFSHPNVLNAHCSFAVDQRLWVVMPFMSGGSLQSIISSSFPNGLPEEFIAIVLKETLNALSYLHQQGHLHRDIKAGNILMDSNGCVKLADLGVSASIFESNLGYGSGTSASSSPSMLTDVMETPYWMAPEVIHSHTGTGYDFKADIWSFGVTALELAHGRPPLSYLPPSKSLIMKIIKRLRFSGYETSSDKGMANKFSGAFKDMVASCLDQDPAKRPSAEELLQHSFFKSYEDIDEELRSELAKYRRNSVWNFNEDGMELDPVFPSDSKDDSTVKQVRFGGQTIIPETVGDSDGSNLNSPDADAESSLISTPGGVEVAVHSTVNAETMVGGLMTLQKSLDDQRQKVTDLINLFGVDVMHREDQLVQLIESLRLELEDEREKNFQLKKELEFLKILIAGESSSDKTD
ncbi:hypothetical protein PTKIN_Ptkin09bG0048700 [Pterospermum kingtungense]